MESKKTKTAAIEYAAQGIRVNAICPAFVMTPMLEQAGIQEGSDFQRAIIDMHPKY